MFTKLLLKCNFSVKGKQKKVKFVLVCIQVNKYHLSL